MTKCEQLQKELDNAIYDRNELWSMLDEGISVPPEWLIEAEARVRDTIGEMKEVGKCS